MNRYLFTERKLLYASVVGIGHIYCTGMIYRDVLWSHPGVPHEQREELVR